MHGQSEQSGSSSFDSFDESTAILDRLDDVDTEIIQIIRTSDRYGQTATIEEISTSLVERGIYDTVVAVANRVDDLVTVGLVQREPPGFTLGAGTLVLGDVS